METEIHLLLTCIRCELGKHISEFEGQSDEIYEQCCEIWVYNGKGTKVEIYQ